MSTIFRMFVGKEQTTACSSDEGENVKTTGSKLGEPWHQIMTPRSRLGCTTVYSTECATFEITTF